MLTIQGKTQACQGGRGGWTQKQLLQECKRRKIKTRSNMNKATLCQLLQSKHKNGKDEKEQKNGKEEKRISEFMNEISDEKLMIPASSPKYNVDKKRLAKFINQFPAGDIRKAAKMLTQQIRYVSFTEWYAKLKEATNLFLESVGQQPFVVICPNNVLNRRADCKSNRWVTHLVLRILKERGRMPYDLAFSFKEAFLRHGLIVSRYMMADDATFSGTQLSNILYDECKEAKLEIEHSKPLTIDVVLPFATHTFETARRKEILSNLPVAVKLHIAEYMPLLKDQIGEKKAMFIAQHLVRPEDSFVITDKPTVYFQHKMPDHFSISLEIGFGFVRYYQNGKSKSGPTTHYIGKGYDNRFPSFYKTIMPGCEPDYEEKKS